jgi:hypothetical protein
MTIKLFAIAISTTFFLSACGGGDGGSTASITASAQAPQLATTLNQLCPKCIATPTTTPSQLETTLKAINPKALATESTSPSQLQLTIEALQSKK